MNIKLLNLLCIGFISVGCGGGTSNGTASESSISLSSEAVTSVSSVSVSSSSSFPTSSFSSSSVSSIASSTSLPATSAASESSLSSSSMVSSASSAMSVSSGDSVSLDQCGFPENGEGLELTVQNVSAGETIPHQLVMLRGEGQSNFSAITVTHDGTETEIPAAGADFKAFALLKPGVNFVGIEAAGHKPLCFEVTFQEPVNVNKVRYILYINSDSAPNTFRYLPANAELNNYFGCLDEEPCDTDTFAEYMKFTGLFHQFILAEMLYEAGLGRQTFTLDREEDGSVRDPRFYSNLSTQEVLDQVTDQGSFQVMNVASREIEAAQLLAGEDRTKTKKLMMFRDIQAGAWGTVNGVNGSLGAGLFHGMAANIPQMIDRLYDLRDPLDFGVAWNSRQTVRNAFEAANGALLHEFGHTLGLNHPSSTGNACAVMGRGYDQLHRTVVAGVESTMCWTRSSGNNVNDHAVHVRDNIWIKAVNE